MATSGSSPSGGQGLSSSLGFAVTEKLARNNLGLWKLQVLPAVRGARLEGYLDGSNPAPSKELDAKDGDKVVKVENPAYAAWVAQDQQLLSYLLSLYGGVGSCIGAGGGLGIGLDLGVGANGGTNGGPDCNTGSGTGSGSESSGGSYRSRGCGASSVGEGPGSELGHSDCL